MGLAEQLLAALTLAVCVVLGVRLCLGPARQQRFDRALRKWSRTLRRGALRLWHWRASRRLARTEAEAVIQRARSGRAKGDDGEWTGNVYTPKSFRKPRRPDQLH
jgi:hypothetical protein